MQARRVEVVRVASPGFFVNAAHRAFRHDEILDSGYYLALGCERPVESSRDAELRFYGPFATEAEARLLAVSAQALGLTEPRSGNPRLPPAAKSLRPRRSSRRAETNALRGSDRTGFELRDGGSA